MISVFTAGGMYRHPRPGSGGQRHGAPGHPQDEGYAQLDQHIPHEPQPSRSSRLVSLHPVHPC